MTPHEFTVLVVYLVVALGTACLWHWTTKYYFLACLGAAGTIALFSHVGSYLELGYRSPWSNLAAFFAFLYGFVFSLLVGLPFAISRKRRRA